MLVNHLYEDQDHNKRTESEYLTYIGKRAFENCFGFKGLFEFKTNIEIYDYAFANTIISVKYIEDKVTLQGEGYGFMDINGSVDKITE